MTTKNYIYVGYVWNVEGYPKSDYYQVCCETTYKKAEKRCKEKIANYDKYTNKYFIEKVDVTDFQKRGGGSPLFKCRGSPPGGEILYHTTTGIVKQKFAKNCTKIST